MADSIKIYTFDVTSIKIGTSDVDAVYVGSSKVYPSSTPTHDYSQDYLTFRALEDCVFNFSGNTLNYSLDSGETWTSLASDTDTPTVASGSTILWKATSPTVTTGSGIGNFSASIGQFEVEGNVMSLKYGDDFATATTLSNYQFRALFDGTTGLTSAENMVLPSTTLSIHCYRAMFANCTNLSVAPALPATTLADYCYYYMFEYCGITTSPVLPASTLTGYCYRGMFSHCTRLTAVTCYATSGIGTYTELWLNDVGSNGIFTRYSNANWGCRGTSRIPSGWTVTPAYEPLYSWIKQDSSVYDCDTETHTKYYVEYYSVSDDGGCTYTTVTPISSRTTSDVIEYDSEDCGYVSPYDYFYIESLADSNTIKITNSAGTAVGTTSFEYSTDSGETWTSFTVARGATKTIAVINTGDKLMMRGTNTRLGTAYNAGHFFRATGNYNVGGSIMSLLNGNTSNLDFPSSVSTFAFAMLFSGSTNLISAENLVINPSRMYTSVYNGTFRGCTSLTTAPELPCTVMAKECYSSMFEGCIALSQPPSVLSATTLADYCYARMFCMSRTSKITTPAMTYSPKMYGNLGSTSYYFQQMFCGNGNLARVECYWTKNSTINNMTNWLNYTNSSGTFYKASGQAWGSGVNGIPSGWTIVEGEPTPTPT